MNYQEANTTQFQCELNLVLSSENGLKQSLSDTGPALEHTDRAVFSESETVKAWLASAGMGDA